LPVEVGIDEVRAAALRRFHNRDVPLAGPRLQPGLELLGNPPQRVPAHWIELPIGVEEPNHPLRLLERLNQPIQQDAIKATIVPTNAVLVVLVERVRLAGDAGGVGQVALRTALAPPSPKAKRELACKSIVSVKNVRVAVLGASD
jgi:hypothetical protein